MPVPPKVKSRIAAVLVAFPLLAARAQEVAPTVAEPAPAPTLAERVLAEIPAPVVVLEDFTGATAENTVLVVILSEQRLRVRVGEKLAVESPATTGRKATPTPEGEFAVKGRTEKLEDEDYGNFVDKEGHVLVPGVFPKLDSPPRSSRFVPVPRKYALEIEGEGGPLRLVAGHVRTTPSTDGVVVVPEAVAWALFEKIPNGAKVRVLKESPEGDAATDPAQAAPPAP